MHQHFIVGCTCIFTAYIILYNLEQQSLFVVTDQVVVHRHCQESVFVFGLSNFFTLAEIQDRTFNLDQYYCLQDSVVQYYCLWILLSPSTMAHRKLGSWISGQRRQELPKIYNHISMFPLWCCLIKFGISSHDLQSLIIWLELISRHFIPPFHFSNTPSPLCANTDHFRWILATK